MILSLGLAPLFTLAADLAVGSAPPERAGAASGISETSSELGGALGLALLGTIGTAVYRGARGGRRSPPSVPADAAATASDTLGGAVEVADRLPQLLAADVLEPAREAFTQGLQVAATVERNPRRRRPPSSSRGFCGLPLRSRWRRSSLARRRARTSRP